LRAQRTYTGLDYTAADIDLAGRLLRLELTLGRNFIVQRGGDWWDIGNGELFELWEEYFGRMIGDAEMTEESLRAKVIAAADTTRRGQAAYNLWLWIQKDGWEMARDGTNRVTWYRHLKTLRAAGLGDADFSCGQVVALRRRVLDARLIETWPELRAA